MPSNTPVLLSVITVVKNGHSTIERCIQSVINQLTPDIEYVVIDGNSSDGTQEIIKKYTTYISYYTSEQDRNLAHAFNKGIEASNGEYFALLNADDWYEENGLLELLKTKPRADVIHAKLRLYKDGKPWKIRKGNHNLLPHEMSINHPATLMRKKVWENLGGFSEKYRVGMDYQLVLRAYNQGFSFEYRDVLVTNMSWGGLSAKHWKTSAKDVMRIKNEVFGKKAIHKIYFYKQCARIYASLVKHKIKNQLRYYG